MTCPLPSPCSDPLIALRAVVLGADGLGWIGRLLALVFGRLEALLLSLRAGLLVVAPVLRDGAGGCDVSPVVGREGVRSGCRARVGFIRLLAVAPACVARAGLDDAVSPLLVVSGLGWLGISAGIVALRRGGLGVWVAVFAIGGLGLLENHVLIVPVI